MAYEAATFSKKRKKRRRRRGSTHASSVPLLNQTSMRISSQGGSIPIDRVVFLNKRAKRADNTLSFWIRETFHFSEILILGKIFTPAGIKADFCHSTLPNVINIHLAPHSHDDVGWKETVDEYYNQGRIQIRKIYSSVIRALTEKEDRKWVLVFHSFFFFYIMCKDR